jgi:O-antigen ligase
MGGVPTGKAVVSVISGRGTLARESGIALGFLFGAASGAIAFVLTGVRGALIAVAIVGALALWALPGERRP